jgi:hypothetical protein
LLLKDTILNRSSVSRPLFIEEHGLRLLLDREGVAVELSRQSYEAGDWAAAIEDAWVKGRDAKWEKRRNGEMGLGLERANEQGKEMARKVVNWAKERSDRKYDAGRHVS